MPRPRYDYHNPLICLAGGDDNGSLLCELTLKALRASKCNAHFNLLDIGRNADNKGYKDGITDKDRAAIAVERIILQAPCLTRDGIARRTISEDPSNTHVMLHYPEDIYPPSLPCTAYGKAVGIFTTGHALFCLQYPENIRFQGEETLDPTGMILAAAMAIEYIGQVDAGQALQQAVLHVIDTGALPYGLYRPGQQRFYVTGDDFTERVCAMLYSGCLPHPKQQDWNRVFRTHATLASMRARHMSAIERAGSC